MSKKEDFKYIINYGIERNKKPLRNIIYNIEVLQLKENVDNIEYEKYKFKDLGYLCLK